VPSSRIDGAFLHVIKISYLKWEIVSSQLLNFGCTLSLDHWELCRQAQRPPPSVFLKLVIMDPKRQTFLRNAQLEAFVRLIQRQRYHVRLD
jgi:hypothetical protein